MATKDVITFGIGCAPGGIGPFLTFGLGFGVSVSSGPVQGATSETVAYRGSAAEQIANRGIVAEQIACRGILAEAL